MPLGLAAHGAADIERHGARMPLDAVARKPFYRWLMLLRTLADPDCETRYYETRYAIRKDKSKVLNLRDQIAP